MIQSHQLTKQFGAFTAVAALDLAVRAGEILALLGPNGAGKTTTIRMLASLLVPTSGSARVAGYDTVTQASQVRRSAGLLTESPGLYPRMRPLDYLDFFGQLQGLPRSLRRERSEELLRRFDLWEARHQPLGEYSKGMRQKLSLIRVMLPDPPVLFLDEPTAALDPASARLVRNSVAGLRGANRAIVLCTHNLVEAEELSDRIAVVAHGRIIAAGTPTALKREWLGPPIFELRVNQGIEPVLPFLNGTLRLLEVGADFLRYETAAPENANPALLKTLTGAGIEVVTLSEVSQNLEAVYTRVVGEQIEAAPATRQMVGR